MSTPRWIVTGDTILATVYVAVIWLAVIIMVGGGILAVTAAIWGWPGFMLH